MASILAPLQVVVVIFLIGNQRNIIKKVKGAPSSSYNRYNKQSIENLKEKEQFTEIDNNILIKSSKKRCQICSQ